MSVVLAQAMGFVAQLAVPAGETPLTLMVVVGGLLFLGLLVRILLEPGGGDDRATRWQRVATLLGSAFTLSRRTQNSLEGEIDGLRLTVEAYREKGGRTARERLRVRIKGAAFPAHFTLLSNPEGRAAERMLPTGDPAFDDRAAVEGPPESVVLALLDADTRRLIVPGVELRDGVLAFDADAARLDAAGIAAAVERLVRLAPRLAPPDLSVRQRLAAGAASDPVPGVRLACTGALLREFPESPEAHDVRGVCRAAGFDVDRLLASARRQELADWGLLAAYAAVEAQWSGAAEALGLRLVPLGRHPPVPPNAGGQAFRLEGEISGFPVQIEAGGASPLSAVAPAAPRLRVSAAAIDRQLSVAAEGALTRLAGVMGMPDLQTGDDAFDRALRLGGDPVALLGALDAATRTTLRAWFCGGGRGGRLEGGVFLLELDHPELEPAKLKAPLAALLALAARFVRAQERPAEVLAENVRTDPEPGVRLANLKLLLRRFPEHAAAVAAATYAVEEAWCHEALDLGCARLADAATIPALERLAASAAAPGEVRAEALARLETRLPSERVGPILLQGLAAAGAPRAVAARALGRLKYAPAFAPLLELAIAAEGDSLLAVAEALGAYADPRAELVLLGILGRPVAAAAREAAAAALEVCGTASSVGPLEAAARATAFLTEERLRARLESAARAIRQRVGTAAAGRLSLAGTGPADGALTLAAEPGALALAPEEARVAAAHGERVADDRGPERVDTAAPERAGPTAT